MQNQKNLFAFSTIVLAVIASLIIAGCSHNSQAQTLEPEQTPDAVELPAPQSFIIEAGATVTTTPAGGAYLPLILVEPTVVPVTPLPTLEPTVQPSLPVTFTGESVFGIEMENVFTGGELLAGKGATWIRRNALLWSAVEPIQGARNWSNVVALERELVEASRLNLNVILIIRSTPSWARKYSTSECGPVRSDKMAAFGKFMGDMVARYSKAPYNVKYFEIWNEPDAPRASGSPVWGCWGETSDVYYGGRYYATALKAAYPLMKAADPEAQVLIGGLLMNSAGSAQTKFFEGILVGGGAPFFDGVSYHTYDYYLGGIGHFGSSNWSSSWDSTGPLLVVKNRFLKSVMQKYKVTGKYIINTELAVICDSCGTNGGGVTNNATYETTKAYYMTQGMAAAMAEGHRAITWYSLGGWWGSALWDGVNPKPALTAFTVGRQRIGGAAYVGEISQADVGVTGLAGYKFKRGDIDVWLVWSRGGTTKTAQFVRMPADITDALGVSYAPAQSFAIGIKPVYIEFPSP
jgi:hypothetical protein